METPLYILSLIFLGLGFFNPWWWVPAAVCYTMAIISMRITLYQSLMTPPMVNISASMTSHNGWDVAPHDGWESRRNNVIILTEEDLITALSSPPTLACFAFDAKYFGEADIILFQERKTFPLSVTLWVLKDRYNDLGVGAFSSIT